MWVQILPQAPYAVLTELVRCRIANPRSGETLREFKSLRLRQRPGRSRMMLAARATPTENDKPMESICVPEGYDLSHRANMSTSAPYNMGQSHPALGRTHQATGTFPRRAKGVQDPAAPSFYHLSSLHLASTGKGHRFGGGPSSHIRRRGVGLPASMRWIRPGNSSRFCRYVLPQSAIFAPVITL